MMLSVYTSKKFENTVTAMNVFLNQVEIQYLSNVCKYHFLERGESRLSRKSLFSREIKRQWLPTLSCIVPLLVGNQKAEISQVASYIFVCNYLFFLPFLQVRWTPSIQVNLIMELLCALVPSLFLRLLYSGPEW